MKRNALPRLPDWYPLSTYSRDLTDDEWVSEVWMRLGFKIAYENMIEGGSSTLTMRGGRPEDVFVSIIQHDGQSRVLIRPDDIDYASSWPVRDMSLFEIEFLAHLGRQEMNSDEKLWAKRLGQATKKWIAEFIVSGMDKRVLRTKNRGPANYKSSARGEAHKDVLGPRLPVMINVTLDDETLVAAFKVWLASLRQHTGSQKAPLTDRQLTEWRKFGVLQAFDLQMWSSLTNARYTDAYIAQAIWPDGDDAFVDRTDRYRKVTKPKAARLFTVWEAERLTYQVKLMAFVRKLAESKDESGTERGRTRSRSPKRKRDSGLPT